VNKSLLKFLTDFGPLVIFFYFYKSSGNNLIVAIPPLIISTLIAVIIVYFLDKKIPVIPLVGAIIISIFGFLTIYFDNAIFIYLKPTIVNFLFAIVLIVGKRIFKKNFLKIMLNNAIQLNDEGWDKLNYRWATFFLFLAFLNELVWRTQTESFWVSFKVWGILPLTIIFTASQLPLIKRYKI
jgi:intracellular septation protein